jgi:hypothetical protein
MAWLPRSSMTSAQHCGEIAADSADIAGRSGHEGRAVMSRFHRRIRCLAVARLGVVSLRAHSAVLRSLGCLKERLSLFHDVRGELRRAAAAHVPDRVDSSVRDEQHLAGLERYRRLAVELIFQRASTT